MNQPLLRFCLAAAAALCGGLASAADGTFRLGPQVGTDTWETALDVPLVMASGNLEPGAKANVGVLGQYIMGGRSREEQDFFVGFEANWSGKSVSHSSTFSVADVPVEVTGDISWRFDLLWLVGYDFGRVRAMLGGGGSYMASDIAASGAGLAGEDSNAHLGWKLAPGIEVELGPSSSVLLRVGYALYQSKKYTASAANLPGLDVDVDIDVDPRVVDFRVAWVYKFGGGK